MATTSSAPQTNGIPPSSSGGTGSQQTLVGTQSQQAPAAHSQNTPSQSAPQTSQNAATLNAPSAQQQHHQMSSSATAPRPRDARTIELLLTAQGVTAYEARVPLLLMDFAYRHSSSVLCDAIHLSADPYTTHAGSKPSATAGAGTASVPGTAGDATVSANAVQLAIQSRLAYQFRGGPGRAGGGGASKNYLQDLAMQRNAVGLPKVAPSEWGVRLPSERFVLSGVGWGLRDVWAGLAGEESDEEEEDEGEEGGEAMEGVETGGAQEGQQEKPEDVGGDGTEGGTMEDMFGDDMEDEEMAE
ncbi:transcription initiation factor tfiid subunit 9b [Pleurostoma richardsiae]|uniref:Transcription initiation factor tfiid subunit 9b n=1 Tax=Pleurostoma richardsiae TaxID=41990 RepID=A0AA38S716_9PEZI|nr:transcription initiation factor tfiid subunit 9b [Pleurostoma richardsiae]